MPSAPAGTTRRTARRTGTKGVPRADREEQILDAALRELGRVGFAATSVAAVAERAGISKPLVYNYFGSKEGLYGACVDHAGDLLGDEIERIAGLGAVGIERGMLTLEGMAEVLDSRPYLWRVLFDPSAPTEGPAADAVRRATARIERIAEEGVTEMLTLAGDPDPVDHAVMTRVWLGIVDTVMRWWADHPEEPAVEVSRRARRIVGALFVDASGTLDR